MIRLGRREGSSEPRITRRIAELGSSKQTRRRGPRPSALGKSRSAYDCFGGRDARTDSRRGYRRCSFISLAGELVTDLVYRQDEFGLLWVLLQLLPQTRDVHIDRSREGPYFVAPHFAQ